MVAKQNLSTLLRHNPLNSLNLIPKIPNLGHWIIKSVQQCPPFLIPIRRAESVAVVGDCLPFYEEEVEAFLLARALDFDSQKAGGGGDEGLCFGHGGFEGGALSGADLEEGVFDDHFVITYSQPSPSPP
jgi:hypothetical protein